MLTITIKVDAPGWNAQGIKEHLAMELERFGDVRVVSVEDDKKPAQGDQMRIFGDKKGSRS